MKHMCFTSIRDCVYNCFSSSVYSRLYPGQQRFIRNWIKVRIELLQHFKRHLTFWNPIFSPGIISHAGAVDPMQAKATVLHHLLYVLDLEVFAELGIVNRTVLLLLFFFRLRGLKLASDNALRPGIAGLMYLQMFADNCQSHEILQARGRIPAISPYLSCISQMATRLIQLNRIAHIPQLVMAAQCAGPIYHLLILAGNDFIVDETVSVRTYFRPSSYLVQACWFKVLCFLVLHWV